MTGGMCFMTITLTFAGVVQTQMQRVVGESYMQVQEYLELFFAMRLASGVIVGIGAVLFLYSVLGPAREQAPGSQTHLSMGREYT